MHLEERHEDSGALWDAPHGDTVTSGSLLQGRPEPEGPLPPPVSPKLSTDNTNPVLAGSSRVRVQRAGRAGSEPTGTNRPLERYDDNCRARCIDTRDNDTERNRDEKRSLSADTGRVFLLDGKNHARLTRLQSGIIKGHVGHRP